MKIGFFDSGLGGLIVLKAVAKALPDFDYIYYGDTKNLPYGDKTEAEIFAMTKAGVGELFNRDCELVIIACNTASAETLRKLQDDYLINNYPDRKILGVIIPTIETVIYSNPNEVLLIATSRTVDSGKYQMELQKRVGDKITLFSISTKELVPLIEAQNTTKAIEVTTAVINSQLQLHPNIKVVILGCTHYTLLKEKLRELFPQLQFVSQDEVIPNKLENYLNNHPEIKDKLTVGKTRNIILTEHRADYDKIAGDFLNGVFMVS